MKKILLVVITIVVSTIFTQAQINLSSGLIAYLPMNGSGNDVSGNGNNATTSAVGAYATTDRLALQNTATLFNGALEQGSMDFGTTLLNNRTNFSMSYWFNPSSITNGMSLVGQDNLLETGFYTAPNRIIVYHPTSGSTNVNISVTAGTWVHVTVTCTNTQMRIYVNGVLTNTIAGNHSLGTTTFNTRIAGNVINQSNNSWFRGKIDEVRFYDRVLTTDEINYLSGAFSMTLLTGTISPAVYCAGNTVNVPYTVIASNLQSDNVFTAQLSDENGNFSNPYVIGTLASLVDGTINATLPTNIPNGTNYKIRVVSSSPQFIGTESSAITINNSSDAFSTLSNGRILYYTFNANTNDVSGNNQHGTAFGGTSYTSDRFGNATGAIQLNGTNGYVNAPAGVWFGGPFTVSSWVKPTSYNNWSRVFDFNNGSPGDNVLLAISNGTTGNLHADIRLGTGGPNAVATTTKPPLNVWSHLVFMHDGTNAKIYMNGILAVSVAIPLPQFVTRVNNYIGRSAWTADAYANAAFDDFMVYNRALTLDEIKVLSNDGIIFYNNTPCIGGTLQLDAPDIAGATYLWTGPNGFNSTLRQNVIYNVSALNSGNYSLTITKGSCAAFNQIKNITFNTGTGTAPTISGLPAITNLQAANNTLTGTPTGGFFTGNGMLSNVFNPYIAGIGTHIILYNTTAAAGCLLTAIDTVSVYDSYNMDNTPVTACYGGFYDSGGSSAVYSANENYTKTFCSGSADKLRFTFSTFSFGTGDTLFVYDGSTTADYLIAYYTYNNPTQSGPDNVWSTGNCITFRFKSDGTSQGNGWVSTFQCMPNAAVVGEVITMTAGMQAVCGATIYDPSGTGNYNTYGTWKQVYRAANPGQRLSFTFTQFAINGNNGGHWVRIYDGPNSTYPLIGQYNNFNWHPGTVQSSGEYLTFVFDVSNTGAGVGGNAGYAGTLTCFGSVLPVFTQQNGTSNTCNGVYYDTGGPLNNYSNNESSVKTFCSDNGNKLRITFNQNEAQIASGDTLFVFDGASTSAPHLATFISGSNMEPMKSSGTCLTFKWSSNASTVNRGWQGFINCVTTQFAVDTFGISSGVRSTCNAFISDGSGGYAYGYGSNTQTYHSYNGNRLKFEYSLLSINGNNGGHWLRIYDGPNTSYPLIGQYNNFNWIPASIESSGAYLTFVFDATNTAAGVGSAQGYEGMLTCTGPVLPTFTLTGTTVNTCEGVFYDSGGPDLNYSNNELQTQTFCSDNGQMIRFTFNNNETQIASGDTLWVFDGSTISAPPLAMYITGSIIEPITSTGTCLTFKWRSNATNVNRGWQGFMNCISTAPSPVTYVMSSGIRNTCSGTLLDPGGTGNYSVGAGQTYVQTFTSYSGEKIRATRNSFSVNGNNGGHWLDVYDGTSTAAPLIGSYNNFNFPPAAFQSTGSSLTFRFRATNTSAGAAAGFDFSISCFTGSPIDVAWLNSPACQGGTLSVPFTVNDPVTTGNIFTAQISDASGSFASPTNIGTLASTATSGTINATIPTGLPAGSGYKVRVNSSAPVQIGSPSPNSIIVNPLPTTPTISAIGGSAICAGDSTLLSIVAQTGVTYQWKRGGINVGANTNTYYASQAGAYTVSVTNGCGTIVSSNTINVIINNAPTVPTITAGGPISFCTGGSVTLTVPSQTGVTYQWKQGSTNVGTNSTSYTATTAGVYTCVITNTCGSVTSSNSITVTILGTAPTAPIITASGATTFCAGGSVVLDIPSQTGVTYQWKQGGTNVGTNTNTYTATVSGVYTVVLTNTCGTANSSNSITVTVNNAPTVPTITAGGPISFCSGGSVTLTVPSQTGVTYQWKQGSTNVGTNSASYTATAAGVYTCEITNGCGAVISSNSITVTILGTAPTAPIITASGATTFCAGGSVVLDIPSQTGVTYQWKQGSTNVGTSTNTYTATVAGVYTVVVSNTCGTINSSNSITVTVNQPDVINQSVTICNGATYVFETQTLTTSGLYVASYTNMNGCDSTINLSLTVLNPIVNNMNVSICAGQSYTFDGQTLTASGSYSASYISYLGCDSTVNLNLTVNTLPLPTVTVVGNLLSTQLFSSYQWMLDGNSISGATAQNYTALVSGYYNVYVTDANGCSNQSDSVYIISTGINSSSVSGLTIAPNPTNGIVRILSSTNENYEVIIFNAIAQVVYNKISNDGVIDVTELAEGVYTLIIKDSNNNQKQFKLVRGSR